MKNEHNVQKLAGLARLAITKEEENIYEGQLKTIVEYVGRISELEFDNNSVLSQIQSDNSALREDEIIECEDSVRQACVESFPSREGKLLKVPAVFADRTE
ncbi:MAG: hypothetical protein ACD_76C00101G0010 [uncultured bacterium]|nr:MAG: hypothetical protein ACD_76C00101G0010 [uncultured bacterium]HBD05679.1 Asp-tRNA(Asn)/Glu-tRNA(Gln) amidotransferase GatCAB subunit C [Candidatus Uhrbacteria bacterium]